MPGFLANGVSRVSWCFHSHYPRGQCVGADPAQRRDHFSERSGGWFILAGFLDAAENCEKESYYEGHRPHPHEVDHRLDAGFDHKGLSLPPGYGVVGERFPGLELWLP